MRRLIHSLAALSILTATCITGAQPISLDGTFEDWPEGVNALADEHHIFVRLNLDEVTSLQSSEEAIHLSFDLDSDTATGMASSTLGVDLEIIVSPTFGNTRDDNFSAAMLIRHTASGSESFQITDADLLWSPTHANNTFEMRFERVGALGALIESASTATLQAIAKNADASVAWEHEPVTFDLPPASPLAPAHATIPSKPDDAIRIVSWNVRWGNPNVFPEKFDRIFQALRPDVILLQEWDTRDIPPETRANIASWFAESLPGAPQWHAERGNAAGVIVVSRFPIERVSPFDVLPITEGLEHARDNRTTRFIATLVDSPIGELLMGSFHLKCCGTYNAYEDHQRRAEARGINTLLKEQISSHSPVGIFLAGDMNLVGGIEPMLDLVDSLDLDGSHMTVADAPVLGDSTTVTWGGNDTRYPRGRLDYAFYSDSTLQVINAFVLDLLTLSEESLASNSLQREDSEASDHLPLVFDIRQNSSSPE